MKLDYSYIGSLCAFRKLNKRIQHTYKIYLTAVASTARNFLLHCKTGVAISHTGTLKAIGMLLPLAFFCFMQGAKGQERAEIKPLEVGDTIPEELWNLPLQVVNHPDGKDTITLNDYRDKKLIILDFWATWCGSCMNSLLKVKEMELPEEVSIIPISSQTAEELRTSKPLLYWFRDYRPFSVCDAVVMSDLFGALSLPHIIWIKDNSIKVVSSSKYLDLENIVNALRGDWTVIKQKGLISVKGDGSTKKKGGER